jgi:hypothetical protein
MRKHRKGEAPAGSLRAFSVISMSSTGQRPLLDIMAKAPKPCTGMSARATESRVKAELMSRAEQSRCSRKGRLPFLTSMGGTCTASMSTTMSRVSTPSCTGMPVSSLQTSPSSRALAGCRARKAEAPVAQDSRVAPRAMKMEKRQTTGVREDHSVNQLAAAGGAAPAEEEEELRAGIGEASAGVWEG